MSFQNLSGIYEKIKQYPFIIATAVVSISIAGFVIGKYATKKAEASPAVLSVNEVKPTPDILEGIWTYRDPNSTK